MSGGKRNLYTRPKTHMYITNCLLSEKTPNIVPKCRPTKDQTKSTNLLHIQNTGKGKKKMCMSKDNKMYDERQVHNIHMPGADSPNGEMWVEKIKIRV